MDFMLRHYSSGLSVVAGIGLSVGGLFRALDAPEFAQASWSIATGLVLAALFFQIVRALRVGDVGLDVIAALSMTAALMFGESLAGNIVALMYAGGQLLESFAQRRARREMTALMGRVARTCMRYQGDGLKEVPIASVMPADRLLIREGEVLPVDGRVAVDFAAVDLSALTGESLPRTLRRGEEALSGSSAAGKPFDLMVSRPAAESAYAGIVRLVEAARDSKAPLMRMADRYAVGFLLVTLAVAGDVWFFTGQTSLVVAVLVVATPCPLILAVPVALVAGMSRAAGMGVLVKGGDELEALAKVRTIVLDKTGTVTTGRPEIADIRTVGEASGNEVLRLAASLDQASGHVVATSLIRHAETRGLALSTPSDVDEIPGTGIEGIVEGRKVVVGGRSFVRDRCGYGGGEPEVLLGVPAVSMTVAVGIDGVFTGIIVLSDSLRPDATEMISNLRNSGATRIVLASGDRSDVAKEIGEILGVDEAVGDLAPDAKVAVVNAERRAGIVMMVGDGVNDAPALASADVGVAMGARGAAASSEVAGVVLMVDDLKPLTEAMAVARRTLRIAKQSSVVGMGLSLAAMIVAALGYLPPVQGALVQELIDVAVILNSLRALR
jgi:heavy metal translocating P-type ATPase